MSKPRDLREYNRQYYLAHREEILAATHERESSEGAKERRRVRWQGYMEDDEFRAKHNDRSRERRLAYRKIVDEAKVGGCIFCDEKHPRSLDFHHVDPATKKERLANVHKFSSPEDVLAEIAKCVLVCANCHRRVEAGLLTLPSAAGSST